MDVTAFIDRELAVVDYLFSVDKYEEAVPHLQNILQQNPVHPQALFFLALVYYGREQFEETRRLCVDALVNGFDKEGAYGVIAAAYEKEYRYPEAEEAYLQGLQANPNSAVLHADYARLMMVTGFWDKARALLNKAMELEPTNQNVINAMIDFSFAERDEKKQREAIQSLMENGSDEIKKIVKLSLYHHFKGDYKQAREYAVQAFLMDPANRNLLALVEGYDYALHPLFLPRRLIGKLGGGAVVFLAIFTVLVLLAALNLDVILAIVFYSFVALVLYNWMVAPVLYHLIARGKDPWTK